MLVQTREATSEPAALPTNLAASTPSRRPQILAESPCQVGDSVSVRKSGSSRTPMLVTPTAYPGGPPGLAARLERGDFWSLVRRFSRWYWSVVAAFVLLAVVFFTLYNGRNAYGVLGLICSLLAVFFAMNPLIISLNLLMDVFYFDQQWAASYRPNRHSSVDLTRVTWVTASSGRWDFQRRARWGIMVPEELILLDPVRTIVSRALKEAERTRTIKMSDRARRLLAYTVSDDSENPRLFGAAIARPPYKAWDDVRRKRRRKRTAV